MLEIVCIKTKSYKNINYKNEIAIQEMTNNEVNVLESEIISEDSIWQIEIPNIDLIAPIAEGTSDKVMNEYVGHFETTGIWEGNIGLAAHNRRI